MRFADTGLPNDPLVIKAFGKFMDFAGFVRRARGNRLNTVIQQELQTAVVLAQSYPKQSNAVIAAALLFGGDDLDAHKGSPRKSEDAWLEEAARCDRKTALILRQFFATAHEQPDSDLPGYVQAYRLAHTYVELVRTTKHPEANDLEHLSTETPETFFDYEREIAAACREGSPILADKLEQAVAALEKPLKEIAAAQKALQQAGADLALQLPTIKLG